MSLLKARIGSLGAKLSRAASVFPRPPASPRPYAWATVVLWAGTSAAQMMNRPTTVWGDLPEEQQGLTFGGVELLTGLLMALVILSLLNCTVLLRARRLFYLAHSAEGSEIEFLWQRTQQTQSWLQWISFALLPLVAVVTLLIAPARTLFGFGLRELSLVLFLVGTLVAAITFLLLEAVRKTLGAERV